MTLLNYCNYVQWVPDSDVVVAQNRGGERLVSHLGTCSPDMPRQKNIKKQFLFGRLGLVVAKRVTKHLLKGWDLKIFSPVRYQTFQPLQASSVFGTPSMHRTE